MSRLPVRDSGDDVPGNWIEYDVEVDEPVGEDHRKRTCTNTLLTNLKVTCDNVTRIAAAGRTHWENQERDLPLPEEPRLPSGTELRLQPSWCSLFETLCKV